MEYNFDIVNARSSASPLRTDATPQLKATLFVGDLPYFCSEVDIFELFRPYGNIFWIRIHKLKQGMPPEYAFVCMPVADAAHAMTKLRGKLMQGRKLFLNWGGATTCFNRRTSSLSVYFEVKSLRASLEANFHAPVVNEEFIRQCFEAFGSVCDVTIKYSHRLENGKQFAFGFVHYDDRCGAGIIDHAARSLSMNPIFGQFHISCKCSNRTARTIAIHGTPITQQPTAVNPAVFATTPILPHPSELLSLQSVEILNRFSHLNHRNIFVGCAVAGPSVDYTNHFLVGNFVPMFRAPLFPTPTLSAQMTVSTMPLPPTPTIASPRHYQSPA